MVIHIPLSKKGKNKGKYETIISHDDCDLAQLNLSAFRDGKYAVFKSDGKNIVYVHRFIMARVLGRELNKKEDVDHINGNGLDNRRENLRLATRSQNLGNRKKTFGASQYKGVCFNKNRGKFVAQIICNYTHYHLGYYNTAEEAHEAYCQKAKELFGEFARFE